MEREAPAPDAGREVIPNSFEIRDLFGKDFVPPLSDDGPVGFFRRAPAREFVEGAFDRSERDTDVLRCPDKRDSTEHVSGKPALVPVRSNTGDQAFALVEVQRGDVYSATRRDLADRQPVGRCERLRHPASVVLDLNLG